MELDNEYSVDLVDGKLRPEEYKLPSVEKNFEALMEAAAEGVRVVERRPPEPDEEGRLGSQETPAGAAVQPELPQVLEEFKDMFDVEAKKTGRSCARRSSARSGPN